MERLNSSHSEQIAKLDVRDRSAMSDEEEVTAITPTDNSRDIDEEPVARPRRSKKRNLFPKLLIAALLLGGAIAGGIYANRWWQYAQVHQETDRAYVNADTQPVTSRIAGIVSEVVVKENQIVNPGDLLIRIDPREYQLFLARTKAAVDVAKQQAELSRQNLNNATANAEATAVNRNPGGGNRQVETARQQYQTAQATVKQREAEQKEAELLLSYTNITSLVPGQIASKNVEVGQRLQPGQPLMTVVQPNPWIVANFKENQIEKIQPGQRAVIKMAAFPSRQFTGKVESVGTASVANKLSAQNSPETTQANNENNGSQRIPVKILFDPDSIKGFENRITPRMSAFVTIQTNSNPATAAPSPATEEAAPSEDAEQNDTAPANTLPTVPTAKPEATTPAKPEATTPAKPEASAPAKNQQPPAPRN